ncbi:MAG: nucleotide exchange factor GrpE [Tissierellia bacterium]|nr:nucleotide exchange factor GrpE [Tissierellia bacterium]
MVIDEENTFQGKEDDVLEDMAQGPSEEDAHGEEPQAEVVEKERYDELMDAYARLQADYMNFKKRNEKERSGLVDLGVEKIAKTILPLLDNFERALGADTEDLAFKQGMELTYKSFIEELKKQNIVAMEALDQDFDPNVHHAVLVEAVDGVDSGKVIEVLQKGYLYGERVLRPAMVKVSE